MSTTPTRLPVPSEKPQDLKFNSGKIDEFVTSLQREYEDRFGNKHYTIEGLRWIAQQAIAAFGYITLKSFQLGAPLPNNELTLPNQILQDETDGEYYRWDGTFPKVVPAGSTPDSTGGKGPGAWVGVGDASLRSQLHSEGYFRNITSRGVIPSGADVSAALSSITGGSYIVPAGKYHIGANCEVGRGVTLNFDQGAAFDIAAGVTLTLNSEIIAGDYQIFSGSGDVVPTDSYMNSPTTLPTANREVRSAWFGVKGDVVYDTYYAPGNEDNIQSGVMPSSGTDSTVAMKKALLFCQFGSLKEQAYVRAGTSPVLVHPAGIILVRGNNPMGSQIYSDWYSAAYSQAASGIMPDMTGDNYKYRLGYRVQHEGGNATTILWKVDAETDVLIDLFFNVTGISVSGLTVQPIIADGMYHGTALHNKSLGLPNVTTGHFNSLSEIRLREFRVLMSANTGDRAITNVNKAAFKRVIHFEGYGRADNLVVKDCVFDGYREAIRCENPESVDHNFEDVWFYPSALNDATEKTYTFNYLAFFGGFRAASCYFGTKISNHTLLRTAQEPSYIGTTPLVTAVFDFASGNRMEGGAGKVNLRLFEGDGGEARFSGLNVSFGGTHASGYSFVRKGPNARAKFSDGTYFGASDLGVWPSSSDERQHMPALEFSNCNYALSTPDNGVAYGGSRYFYAVKNALAGLIPGWMESNTYSSRPLKNPPYGSLSFDNELSVGHIGKRIGTSSIMYIGAGLGSLNLPECIVIESIQLSLNGHTTSTFDRVRLRFTNALGSLDVSKSLDGSALYKNELLTSGQGISTGLNSANLSVTFLLGSTELTTNYAGDIVIKYRAARSNSDLPASDSTLISNISLRGY